MQEYWSGFPFPSPGDLPDPGIEPASAIWQVDFFFFNHQTTWEVPVSLVDPLNIWNM